MQKHDAAEDAKIVGAFEEALYARARGGAAELKEYLRLADLASAAFEQSPGPFPDRPLAVRMRCRSSPALDPPGGVSPLAAAQDAFLAPPPPPPREHSQRRLLEALLADPRFAAARARAASYAQEIETGCYNWVISASKDSQHAYRRAWNDPAFAALYSTRCMTVLQCLDPRGETCLHYGTGLLGRLYEGREQPRALGAKTAAELCPETVREERATIELRRNQKVVKKWSSLFKCACGRRQSTYHVDQQRSLDEPPTIKITCFCGNEWSKN